MSNPLTVADGTVYVNFQIGGQSQCDAVDAETGSLQWYATVDGDGTTENNDIAPAVSDGVVYVGDGGTLYAFDAADGTEQWQTDVYADACANPRARMNTPVVVDGTVYITGQHQDPTMKLLSLSAVSGDDGSILWQTVFGEGDAYHLKSPAISDGTAFVTWSGKLYAFSTDDGTKQWESDLSGMAYEVYPSVADGVVYLPIRAEYETVPYPGSDESTMWVAAFDADNGTERWRVPLRIPSLFSNGPNKCVVAGNRMYITDNGFLYSFSGPTKLTNWWENTADIVVSSPALGNAVVYVQTADGFLRAFNRANGEELWNAEIGQHGNEGHFGTTVEDGIVYVGVGSYSAQDSEYRAIRAFDAASGNELWRFDTEDSAGTPVVHDGTVYFAERGPVQDVATVYALDAKTGEEQWSVPAHDDDDPEDIYYGVSDTVSILGDSVLVVTDISLRALDIADGSEQWEYRGEITAVTTTDDAIYAGETVDDGSRIVELNADGTTRWRSKFDVSAVKRLTVADGRIYAVVDSGYNENSLFVFDSDDGSNRWSFGTPTVEQSSTVTLPVVEDGIVYIGSNDRRVYALDAETGDEQTRFETFGSVRHAPTVDDGTLYTGSANWVQSFGQTR